MTLTGSHFGEWVECCFPVYLKHGISGQLAGGISNQKEIQLMNVQASLYPGGETLKIIHNSSEISKGNSVTTVGTSSSAD